MAILNLYRVCFADQSSRQFTSPDIGAVYEVLNTKSNPITGVQLVKADVGVEEVVVPVSEVRPFGPPVHPCPVPPPCPPDHLIHEHHPTVHTNRLVLLDIKELYQPMILFGIKSAEAYRTDFIELKRGKSLYQFAVPAFIGGEMTVVQAITPSSVHFDASGGCAVVSFTSYFKPVGALDKHLWLTTLKIYIDRIDGGSEDLTLAQAAAVDSAYINVLPMKENDTSVGAPVFYPTNGDAEVFPDWKMSNFISYFPQKTIADYQRDFDVFLEGKKIYKLAIPIGGHGVPIHCILLVTDVALDTVTGHTSAYGSFMTMNTAGMWLHTIKIRNLKDYPTDTGPLTLHSKRIYP
jgi:hypothetical protein